MLKILKTTSFKKQLKRYKHNTLVLDELDFIIEVLATEKSIPAKYKNHKLIGNFEGINELHLKPDDLLIYFKIENESITLVAIGSHSDLF